MKKKLKISDVDLQIEKALNFAIIQHSGQFREGTGIPYVAHPLDVLKQLALWEIYKSEENIDLWVTAIIHDTWEDGERSLEPAALELIAELFNKRIACWVEALSFRKRRENESSAEYQTAKSAHFNELVLTEVEVIVIKLADRIRNTYDFLAYGDYAPKYYQRGSGIIDAFFKRKEDIANRFGDKSVALMKLSILSLETEINVPYLTDILISG